MGDEGRGVGADCCWRRSRVAFFSLISDWISADLIFRTWRAPIVSQLMVCCASVGGWSGRSDREHCKVQGQRLVFGAGERGCFWHKMSARDVELGFNAQLTPADCRPSMIRERVLTAAGEVSKRSGTENGREEVVWWGGKTDTYRLIPRPYKFMAYRPMFYSSAGCGTEKF
eukprot:3933034-Rhodomonas_salina.1